MALSNNHSLTESHLLICRVMGDLMNLMMGHMRMTLYYEYIA